LHINLAFILSIVPSFNLDFYKAMAQNNGFNLGLKIQA
jgi:hypothetical protein